jgi:hypothetical protein
MKNLLITFAVALVACAAAFGVFYAMNDQPALRQAVREGDAMGWLREEFHLNDAQFAAVKKLHADYNVVCADHCAAIAAAKQRGASSSELAALEKKCVDAMTTHFRQVAALLPPGEGERYLALVLPHVQDYDHHGAPNLQGKS